MDRSKRTVWQELAALRQSISTLTGLVGRNTGTLQEVISRVAKLEERLETTISDIDLLAKLGESGVETQQDVIKRVIRLEMLVSNCNEDIAGVCDRLDRLEAHVGIACTCGTGPVKPSLEQHFDSCPWIEF